MTVEQAPIRDGPRNDSQAIGSGLRILLTDTKRWAVGPRIGMAFAAMGCEVGMLCPRKGHPAHAVKAIRRRYSYRGADMVGSLREAIEDFDPHLVLPVCDRAVSHLHRLYQASRQRNQRRILGCIEGSLGPARSFPIVTSRYDLLMLARELGIAIPDTVALKNEEDLRAAGRLGLPLVIKADGTWGGTGVKIAQSQSQALRAMQDLSARNRLPWLIKELALNRDRGTTFDDWRNIRRPQIAQKWIEGHPANCAAACADGKILAGVAVEVLATNGEHGPATLVEVVPGREMLKAAERIVNRLGLSGFVGLDFMIDRESGVPYLIEMNPRCTQAATLLLGKGRNLPAAMCAHLAGVPEPETAPVTNWKRIAYFPKPDASSDPDASLPAESYYYDLPANEPAFVEQMLHPWRDRGRLGRCLDHARDFAARMRTHSFHFSTHG